MTKTQHPARCYVCDERKKVTREHVLPRWIRRHLTKREVRMDKMIILICADCNAALGQKFEEPTSRLLRPIYEAPGSGLQRAVFSSAQQRILGAWRAKTAVVDLLRQTQNPQDPGAIRSAILRFGISRKPGSAR